MPAGTLRLALTIPALYCIVKLLNIMRAALTCAFMLSVQLIVNGERERALLQMVRCIGAAEV
jgi:hypothetical protein